MSRFRPIRAPSEQVLNVKVSYSGTSRLTEKSEARVAELQHVVVQLPTPNAYGPATGDDPEIEGRIV